MSASLFMRSGEQLAVKQIYIQEELEQGNDVSSLSIQRVLTLQQIVRETDILASLHHPNIVKYIGSGTICLLRVACCCCCSSVQEQLVF